MTNDVANPNYERTYEIIDLDHPPELVNETHDEYQFLCPNCEAKRGRPDRDGKFFFNKVKLKGLCFKCNTVFFPEVEEDETGNTDPKLNIQVNSTQQKVVELEFNDPGVMEFNFPELKPTDLAYLKKRQPFLPMLAPVLGLKSWYGSNGGIVVPYLYKNYVSTFQVRYINPKDKKYYIPAGSDKIPYSPEHLLTRFRLGTNETISICEGWADAVALWVMGYPHPVAIQGSSLSDYQSMILRKLMPSNAFIVMDKFEISQAIQKTLKKQLPSVERSRIVCFGNDIDPEEQLRSDIQNKEKYQQYFANTMQLLKDRIKT